MKTNQIRRIEKFSKQIQMETMKSIASLGVGHIGGALSIADVLAVLYDEQMQYDAKNPIWEDRDWLVISKGHAGPALYATLALKGFFPMGQLQTLNRPHTHLPSHCDRNLTTGVDMTTGSLGQGASSAAGVATALKMDGKKNTVFLILGDGEIEEGQVWEMAMFAAHRKLDNLIAFVDNNHLQIDGTVEDICSLTNIAERFQSFGWYVQSVNGHDISMIDTAIENAKAQTGRPSMIVLDTIKGHGWSAIEGKVGSHSCNISAEELENALAEMRQAMELIGGDVE